jgi:hypothetical protein
MEHISKVSRKDFSSRKLYKEISYMQNEVRVVDLHQVADEKPAYSVNSSYALQLEKNRKAAGATLTDQQSREAAKARLAAKHQAIIDRVSQTSSDRKTDFFTEQLNTQKRILRSQLGK